MEQERTLSPASRFSARPPGGRWLRRRPQRSRRSRRRETRDYSSIRRIWRSCRHFGVGISTCSAGTTLRSRIRPSRARCGHCGRGFMNWGSRLMMKTEPRSLAYVSVPVLESSLYPHYESPGSCRQAADRSTIRAAIPERPAPSEEGFENCLILHNA